MLGDDASLDGLKRDLDNLRRETQEATGALWGKVNELDSRQSRLDARLIALNVMLEERDQH